MMITLLYIFVIKIFSVKYKKLKNRVILKINSNKMNNIYVNFVIKNINQNIVYNIIFKKIIKKMIIKINLWQNSIVKNVI